MSQQESSEFTDPVCRIAVFECPGAGDRRQLQTVVDLLGGRGIRIANTDSVLRVILDRLTALPFGPIGQGRHGLDDWPDLALIAGGRNVIEARRLVRDSGGRTRLVCIGRPWAPLAWFDLVISTPQYGLPGAPNVLQIELPLNTPPRSGTAERTYWKTRWSDLPRPMLGVLLGGHSGSYRFDPASADRIADLINRLMSPLGGSVVVVGSPRTPTGAIARIRAGLRVPAQCHPFAPDQPNPYASVLGLADALAVTGDSASMLAEACFSGRRVAILPLRQRVLNRWLTAGRRASPLLDGMRERLTRRGWWVPARDMQRMHRMLEQKGWVRPLGELFSEGASGTTAPRFETIAERVRGRIEMLLNPSGNTASQSPER